MSIITVTSSYYSLSSDAPRRYIIYTATIDAEEAIRIQYNNHLRRRKTIIRMTIFAEAVTHNNNNEDAEITK